MSKQSVKARQERLRRLAERDSISRCRFCRRELPAGYLIVMASGGGVLRFCSQDCRDDEISASEARR